MSENKEIRRGAISPFWRSVALVAFALLILGVFWFGRASVNVDLDTAAGVMGSAESWIAWPITIAIFIAASFLGVPQFVLIAGAVVAFGPLAGAGLSWVGTMMSASAHFASGRLMGGTRLRARAGPKVGLWMDRLAAHGIMASFWVRLIPVAPALMVNMAGGASPMRFRDFLTGTALGILPKIAVIALFGKGLGEWLISRDGRAAGIAIVLGLLILGVIWLVRRRRVRLLGEESLENSPKSEGSP